MPLSTDLQPELRLALRLALSAGDLALTINQRAFEVEEKPDDLGPVTEADRAASRLIVDGLKGALPQDDVLSEEEEPRLQSDRRLWCVDPIDGTKEFVKRNAEWSVLIGLAREGEPALGVVYQPTGPGGGRVWFARRGAGAWLASPDEVARALARDGAPECGRRLKARGRGEQEPLLVVSRSHRDAESEALGRRLGIERQLVHGSVGIKLALIADGTGDFYVNSAGKTSLWDLCAGDAILREAGGRLVVRPGPRSPLGPLRYLPGHIQVTEQVFAMGRGWSPEAIAGA